MYIVFIFLFLAAVYDLAKSKIPNWFNGLFLVVSILYVILQNDFQKIGLLLLKVIVAFSLYIWLYVFKAMGAGDVKLIIALSVVLGISMSMKVTFLSMILAIIFSFFKFGIKAFLSWNIKEESGTRKIKMAPFVFVSTVFLSFVHI